MKEQNEKGLTGILSGYFSLMRAASACLLSDIEKNKFIRRNKMIEVKWLRSLTSNLLWKMKEQNENVLVTRQYEILLSSKTNNHWEHNKYIITGSMQSHLAINLFSSKVEKLNAKYMRLMKLLHHNQDGSVEYYRDLVIGERKALTAGQTCFIYHINIAFRRTQKVY